MEDFPWGHTALKVRGKIFVWLDESGRALSLTVKLPVSRDFAEIFDFAAPAGYGLGRSGWISCRFARRRDARSRPAEALDRRKLPRGRAEEAGGAAARATD